MNKNKIILILTSIAVLGAGFYAYSKYNKSSEPKVEISTSSSTSANNQSGSTNNTTNVVETNKIIKKDYWTTNGSKKIYGQIVAPENYENKKLPIVLLSHGFGGTHSSMSIYAEALAKKGYLTYSIDFSGGSRASKSDGNILDMSVFTEEEDLLSAFDSLKKENYVDNSNMFLLGASQGGVVSTIVAADRINEVKGLITLSPAYVLFDDARDIFKSVSEIPESYNHRGNMVGRVYFEKSLDYDIYNTMTKINKPVLIVHGTADNIAPISYSERAISTFSDAKLVKIDGAGHMFNSKDNEISLKNIEDFLSDRIK